jgi:hypothetical protein
MFDSAKIGAGQLLRTPCFLKLRTAIGRLREDLVSSSQRDSCLKRGAVSLEIEMSDIERTGFGCRVDRV